MPGEKLCFCFWSPFSLPLKKRQIFFFSFLFFFFNISQTTDFICISLFFSTNIVFVVVALVSHIAFGCHVSLILSNL